MVAWTPLLNILTFKLGFKMLILVSECNVCNMESCKIEQINLCWELKDYWIYYDCKHAFTSSVWNFYHWVTEVPLSKTSQATRSKEKWPFLQANSLPTKFMYPATWNLSESPATCKQLSGLCQKTLPEPNLCLKFCRQPMRVLLKKVHKPT